MPVRLVVGPMGGEKSLRQMMLYKQWERDGFDVLALKPAQDTRDKSFIKSRKVKWSIPAVSVTSLSELIQMIKESKADRFVLDESHLLGRNLKEEWLEILPALKDRVLSSSSILLGWDGEIVDPFYTLRGVAETIEWRQAECSFHGPQCNAFYSWKIDPDGPDVGELGKEYESYCPAIWLNKYIERFGVQFTPRKVESGFNMEMAYSAQMAG